MPVRGVEARRARQARVDDDPHAGDRQRRLGDVGGEHDAPTARRRGRQREVLLGQRQRAGERHDVDVVRQRAVRAPPRCAVISPMPGQEHEHVARLLAERAARTASAAACSIRSPVGRSARQRMSTGNVRPALVDHRRRSPSAARAATRRGVSGVADIASIRRSGRIVRATSSASARPRSVGRLRSWTSSKITSADAGQRRVVLQAAGQDALGDHLDPRRRADRGARRGSGSRRCRRPCSPSRSAMRRAAARVARRRGSSITIRRPSSHGSSSSASGTSVVLPAPGGATMTARPGPASASRTRRASRRPAGRELGVVGTTPPRSQPAARRAGERARVARQRDQRRRASRPSRRSSSATSRHAAGFQPSASAATSPSTRTKTNAGSRVEPHRLHRRPVGVAEHEELVGQRTEERRVSSSVRR